MPPEAFTLLLVQNNQIFLDVEPTHPPTFGSVNYSGKYIIKSKIHILQSRVKNKCMVYKLYIYIYIYIYIYMCVGVCVCVHSMSCLISID